MIKFNRIHNAEGADRMSIIDDANELLNDEDVKNAAFDLLSDSKDALSGSLFAVARILFSAIHTPFALRDKIFWMKFKKFLGGVFTTEEQKAKFATKLASEGNKNDNAMRLLSCIEKSDAEKKIDYLINASCSLSANFITLEEYFRICHVITQSVMEDLRYLAEHILENDLDYSIPVQGLVSEGLMIQTQLNANTGEHKYNFTPLAELVDRFAVSCDNAERYPNPLARPSPDTPNIRINGVVATFG